MSIVYESAKRMVSTKTTLEKKSADYRCLVDLGWITEEQATSFYFSAQPNRHGYPRDPIKPGETEMQYSVAVQLITYLFWRFVDHLQPE